MKKKIIFVLLFLMITATIFIKILKNIPLNINNNNNFVEKKPENLNPISKESAKKILEAELGKDIIILESDFKDDGDYYVIDVNINIENFEEHNSNQELNINCKNHIINFGIYKINKYTGELLQE